MKDFAFLYYMVGIFFYSAVNNNNNKNNSNNNNNNNVQVNKSLIIHD